MVNVAPTPVVPAVLAVPAAVKITTPAVPAASTPGGPVLHQLKPTIQIARNLTDHLLAIVESGRSFQDTHSEIADFAQQLMKTAGMVLSVLTEISGRACVVAAFAAASEAISQRHLSSIDVPTGSSIRSPSSSRPSPRASSSPKVSPPASEAITSPFAVASPTSMVGLAESTSIAAPDKSVTNEKRDKGKRGPSSSPKVGAVTKSSENPRDDEEEAAASGSEALQEAGQDRKGEKERERKERKRREEKEKKEKRKEGEGSGASGKETGGKKNEDGWKKDAIKKKEAERKEKDQREAEERKRAQEEKEATADAQKTSGEKDRDAILCESFPLKKPYVYLTVANPEVFGKLSQGEDKSKDNSKKGGAKRSCHTSGEEDDKENGGDPPSSPGDSRSKKSRPGP